METKTKKVEIEIPVGKKIEWVNGVLTLVDEKPKDVTERIKTFEDACHELGESHPLVKEWQMCGQNLSPDLEDTSVSVSSQPHSTRVGSLSSSRANPVGIFGTT